MIKKVKPPGRVSCFSWLVTRYLPKQCPVTGNKFNDDDIKLNDKDDETI